MGNTEAPQSARFEIDGVAPTTTDLLTGTAGTNGWYTSRVQVTLTANDATSGVAATYYTIDNGGQQIYTGPFTVTGDAQHTVQFYSVDLAGNQEAMHSQTILIDSTAPVLHLPANQVFVETQAGGGLINYVQATASDNLTTAVVVETPAPGTFFPLGTTVVEVTGTDAAGNQAHGSFTVTVNLAPATHLVIKGTPAQVIVGGGFDLTVDAENSVGDIDTAYNGAITLRLGTSPVNGKLGGITPATVQNGVATLRDLSLNVAGSYQLSATSSTGLMAGVSSPITVDPATHFSISGLPSTISAGQSLSFAVTALTAQNKVDPTYTGTIQLASNDLRVAFSAPGNQVTFTPNDDGKVTVQVVLNTAGSQTISASDVTLGTAKGISKPVAVTSTAPLILDHFTVTGLPSSDITGVAHAVTITAVNVAGKTVTHYTGTVQLSSSDPTFKPVIVHLVKGVGKCSISLTSLGTQALTATATDGSGTIGTETNILVVSPATHLGIASSAAKITAGGQILLTVTGLTASNRTDTLFTDISRGNDERSKRSGSVANADGRRRAIYHHVHDRRYADDHRHGSFASVDQGIDPEDHGHVDLNNVRRAERAAAG